MKAITLLLGETSNQTPEHTLPCTFRKNNLFIFLPTFSGKSKQMVLSDKGPALQDYPREEDCRCPAVTPTFSAASGWEIMGLLNFHLGYLST